MASKPPITGKVWEPDELKELKRLYSETDLSVRAIGLKLNRPPESARDRLKRMVKDGELVARPSKRKQRKPKPTPSGDAPSQLSAKRSKVSTGERRGRPKGVRAWSRDGFPVTFFLEKDKDGRHDHPLLRRLKVEAAAAGTGITEVITGILEEYFSTRPVKL